MNIHKQTKHLDTGWVKVCMLHQINTYIQRCHTQLVHAKFTEQKENSSKTVAALVLTCFTSTFTPQQSQLDVIHGDVGCWTLLPLLSLLYSTLQYIPLYRLRNFTVRNWKHKVSAPSQLSEKDGKNVDQHNTDRFVERKLRTTVTPSQLAGNISTTLTNIPYRFF